MKSRFKHFSNFLQNEAVRDAISEVRLSRRPFHLEQAATVVKTFAGKSQKIPALPSRIALIETNIPVCELK